MSKDVMNMTSSEVNKLIFGSAAPNEHVAMPLWIAEQIVQCDHFDHHLMDWAFWTLEMADQAEASHQ